MSRAEHRGAPSPPWRTPSRSERSGRHSATSAKSTVCNRAARIERPTSFPFCLRGRLTRLRLAGPLDGQLQSPRNFTGDLGVRHSKHGLAGMEYNIHRCVQCGPRSSYRFPHATFNAIALDRATQYLTHRESYTQRVTGNRAFTSPAAPQEEHRHVTGELATAGLVNALKVRMSQQMLRLRKLIPDGGHNLHTAPIPAQSTPRSQWDRGLLVIHATVGWKCGRARRNKSKQLLAETRLYGDALASLGATAGNNRPSALGLHTRTKPVRLGPATTVGLECALGHSRTALLTGKKLDRANQKYTVRQARLANRPVSQGRVMSAGETCGRE
jgi:hypothetical protein